MRVNKKVIEGAAVVIFALTITVTTAADGNMDIKAEQYTAEDVCLEDVVAATKEKSIVNIVAAAADTADIPELAAVIADQAIAAADELTANQPVEALAGVEETAGAEAQPTADALAEGQLEADMTVGEQSAESQPADAAMEGQPADITAEDQPADVTAEGQPADAQQSVENQSAEDVASPWASRLMPEVEEYLNIRSEASEESEVLGKLRKGDMAEILERGEEWSKISSGNVEGYVKNEYCVFDEAAEAMANEQGTVYATALTGGLRVRAEASTSEETGIVNVLGEGEKLKVDTEAEVPEGWVAVKYSDTTAYVSAEYVSVELELGKAISMEEERAAIKKAQEEAAKKNQKSSGGTTQNEAVAASYDDVTLLGALIQCEAGGESYEGQLAVGAVVMNRLRRGYAGSISGVIYQSGQFSPASSGALANVLARGVSGSCLSAAQAAIGGADNVGGATNFRSASSGQAGIVIGNHVFY